MKRRRREYVGVKTKEKNSKGKPQAEWIQKTLPFIFNHVKMSFKKKPTKLQPVTKVRQLLLHHARLAGQKLMQHEYVNGDKNPLVHLSDTGVHCRNH